MSGYALVLLFRGPADLDGALERLRDKVRAYNATADQDGSHARAREVLDALTGLERDGLAHCYGMQIEIEDRYHRKRKR